MSNAERQRRFRQRNPGYYARIQATKRASSSRGMKERIAAAFKAAELRIAQRQAAQEQVAQQEPAPPEVLETDFSPAQIAQAEASQDALPLGC